MKAQVFFDGGARPSNPGHAGFGVLVVIDGREIEIGRYIGIKTNNEAEYTGLLVGLKVALDNGATSAVVTGDSQLVIKQVAGEWKCKKDHLKPLLREATQRRDQFEQIEFVHVRGHRGHVENERVDTLCTDAILAGMSKVKKINPFTKKAGLVQSEGKVVDPFQ